jgi:hypothetical protein
MNHHVQQTLINENIKYQVHNYVPTNRVNQGWIVKNVRPGKIYRIRPFRKRKKSYNIEIINEKLMITETEFSRVYLHPKKIFVAKYR